MSDNKDQHSEDKDKQELDLEPFLGQQSRLDLFRGNERTYYLTGFSYILIFIPVVIVLAAYDDGCDKPVREWLIVVAVVSGIFSLYAIAEAAGNYVTASGKLVSASYSLLSLFYFVWNIVGSVWLFSDDDCSDDWSSGYTMTLVLLILFYIAVGIMVLVCLCCCCCVGVIAGVVSNASPPPNLES